MTGPRAGAWLASAFALACGPNEPAPRSSGPTIPAAPSASASAAPAATVEAIAEVPVDEALVARMKADVAAVSGERPPGSPRWLALQKTLRERLTKEGFDVDLQNFRAEGPGVNVIGKRPGATRRSEVVLLSAHYDHVPGCDGADDNASGVAVVLEVARALGGRRFDRTLVLCFWDWEEWGLHGSAAWVAAARARGDDVRVAVSLDGVGYADRRPGSQRTPDGLGMVVPDLVDELERGGSRGDFIAVIGDASSQPFVDAYRAHGRARGLRVLGAGLSAMARLVLIDAARSDHASFWLAGYPGVLVTDTANFRNPGYHCMERPDVPESLDYDFLARVAQTTSDAVAGALGPAGGSP